MLLIAGLAVAPPRGHRPARGLGLAGLRRRARDLRPDAPAAEQPAPGDPRGAARRATSSGSGTARSSTPAGRSSPSGGGCSTTLAGPLAAAHAEIAPDEAAAGRLTLALRDERPATPRRVAAGRARPAPRRDGREGGLERLDARRAAPRRPGLRARRPGPRRRSRRAASSGRRSSPSSSPSSTCDRPRRPPAAPPARRRLLASSTRSAARTSSGGSRRCPRRSSRRRRSTTSTPSCARSRRPGRCAPSRTARDCSAPTGPAAQRPAVAVSRAAAPADGPARRPHPGRGPGLGLEDELRLSRAMATFEALVAERVPAAAGACRVVRLEGFALDVEADAPIVAQELRLRSGRAADRLRGRAGRGRRARIAGPRPARRSPRIIPRHLPATSEATDRGRARHRARSDLVRPSPRRPGSRGPPDHERPGWPYGSR